MLLDGYRPLPRILAPSSVPNATPRTHPKARSPQHVPLVTAQELIDAGVHYGHQASRWNPKMKPFIHGKRHKIHVINLEETIRGLYQATHFLRSLAATGAQIMFLGTKKQIRPVVEAEARKCGMPPVTERWIGGTLTNFATVRERLARLLELEQLETTGGIEKYKKKDQSTIRREIKRIRRNLEGVRDLHGLPGALVVVDPRREDNAMREAKRMNVPVVCVLDTDCDPTLADIVIPANDDAMSSVQLILGKLAEAIMEGRQSCDEGTLRDAQKTASEDVRNRQAPGRRSNDRDGGRGGMRRGGGPGGDRGRRGPGGPGGGGSRYQAGGHATSVSIGGDRDEAAAAPASAPAPAPAAEAPAGGDAPTEGQS
ncbi:MAG: 30S ribosomal protein S2 [Planctomycetes bacterium]|nr:30S ribosomal protein S2 [Planctomycetota bacterium]